MGSSGKCSTMRSRVIALAVWALRPHPECCIQYRTTTSVWYFNYWFVGFAWEYWLSFCTEIWENRLARMQKQAQAGVTGKCVSQGCVFRTHISLGCVFPHTHITNNWLQVTVICVSQGNMFPLKFHWISLLHLNSSLKLNPSRFCMCVLACGYV